MFTEATNNNKESVDFMDRELTTLTEGIFSNSVNNAARWAFNKVTNPFKARPTTKYPPQKRGPGGKFLPVSTADKVRHTAATTYNNAENGIEALINFGKSIVGSGLSEELPQLKAKMYYVVLRQQPPVGTAFKKKLQQDIFDCHTVVDLDKLAARYNVTGQWERYKHYLQTHGH